MLDRKKNDYYFTIFLNLVRATYMYLEKDWDNEAQVCGISYAQQHCLWLLHIQDGLTLTELGNIAVWNKSTTSALVSRLQKKKLVEKRRQKGTNVIRIYLTKEGWKKIEESINTKECIEFMGLFKDHKEEEVVEILSFLKRIYDEVSKDKNSDFNRFINEYSENLLKIERGPIV
ncbi:MAG: MarR family transcriptional regulator [Hespellia sp.]|jgi:MarR family protease production transcriptional regulator HPr|nr:MarR family transcriptional regulator [Hespellia sp.]